MFSALLIGTGDWYSTKCKLTWKMKGTSYNRMYFQLVPSTHRTVGIGFGLLPTVTAMDSTGATANMKSSQVKEGSMHSVTLSRFVGMIPTVRARDGVKGSDRKLTLKDGKWQNLDKNGTVYGMTLEQTIRIMPQGKQTTEQDSATSQLNPRFVAEMMGFPPNWTESPFLSGEKNP
jgi:hypothetical protein